MRWPSTPPEARKRSIRPFPRGADLARTRTGQWPGLCVAARLPLLAMKGQSQVHHSKDWWEISERLSGLTSANLQPCVTLPSALGSDSIVSVFRLEMLTGYPVV
jgi:hypothetical protein